MKQQKIYQYSYKNIILTIIMCLFCTSVFAQNVSNATATQVGKTIHVSYDLDNEADITLFLSTDGGITFSQLYSVSGDVGENIHAGHKTIVWDVLSEVGDFRVDNVVFTVRCDMPWRKKVLEQKKQLQIARRYQQLEIRKNEPLRNFFTLNVAYSPLPQWSYGFKFGQVKIVGWYVNAMSNFQFKGMYHPFKEEQDFYMLTGKSKTIRLSVQAGFVVRPCKPMSFLLGVGYGYRTQTFQTTDQKAWYSYAPRTYHGVDVSFGFLFDIKGFAMSAEAVTTNFKTIEANIGLGFCISDKTKNGIGNNGFKVNSSKTEKQQKEKRKNELSRKRTSYTSKFNTYLDVGWRFPATCITGDNDNLGGATIDAIFGGRLARWLFWGGGIGCDLGDYVYCDIFGHAKLFIPVCDIYWNFYPFLELSLAGIGFATDWHASFGSYYVKFNIGIGFDAGHVSFGMGYDLKFHHGAYYNEHSLYLRLGWSFGNRMSEIKRY